MRVESFAKINWSLRVTGKRADGYHDLETLFQTISLHDTLTFRESDRLTLTCDDPTIPTDETNLILRAARALDVPPVAIELHKRIPAGGGLGGGSSNAAATLVALSQMFGIEKPLHEAALSLGSDVPFFLIGGTAYATGRGEVLTPMPSIPGIPLLLVFPEERVSTPRAFAMLRSFSKPLGIDRAREIVDQLATQLRGDAASKPRSRAAAQPFRDLTNDFEEPVFAELPHLGAMKSALYDRGAAWAAISGSGSTIVGAFRTAAARDAALGRLKNVRAVAAETV